MVNNHIVPPEYDRVTGGTRSEFTWYTFSLSVPCLCVLRSHSSWHYPNSPSSGSADPSLPPAGPLSHYVVSSSADMTLYVVFLPVFPGQ
ncbi:hypothetical protein FZN28_19060 [Escherichia coli]|nr:hypothetical protein [Escherichia coli]EEY4101027.1 hypothetical protein [Escherichia coli]NAQ11050.1 hypothetical protein [Escherichia coli]